MVHHPVHEITIMRYHHQASLKIEQKVFQNGQGWKIQIIGWFIQDQKIGILEKNG